MHLRGLCQKKNNIEAQVAQSVEQRTENPRVGSSILSLGTTSYKASQSNDCEAFFFLCNSSVILPKIYYEQDLLQLLSPILAEPPLSIYNFRLHPVR